MALTETIPPVSNPRSNKLYYIVQYRHFIQYLSTDAKPANIINLLASIFFNIYLALDMYKKILY
jgi:hypothetical protein